MLQIRFGYLMLREGWGVRNDYLVLRKNIGY